MIYLFALLCVISNWSTEVHEVSIATDMENVPLCIHIHKMEIYTGILIGFFTVCFQTTLVYKTSNSQAEGRKYCVSLCRRSRSAMNISFLVRQVCKSSTFCHISNMTQSTGRIQIGIRTRCQTNFAESMIMNRLLIGRIALTLSFYFNFIISVSGNI